MTSARQIFLGKRGKKLPYDAQVEYLEFVSNGAYIDTGVIIDDNDYVLTCEMNATTPGQTTAWCTFFGSYTSESAMSTRLINFSTNSNYFYAGYRRASGSQSGINVAPIGGATKRGIYKLSYRKLDLYNAGASVTVWTLNDNSGQPDTSTVKIATAAKMKCYGFSIEHSGVTVLDYIPVRVGTEGMFYDRVSGTLVRNAGSGSIIPGSDFVPTNGYITSGLVAWWDGIDNAGIGVHDPSATSWKNLVAGSVYGDISAGVPYSDYWDMAGATYHKAGQFTTPLTVEVVMKELSVNLVSSYTLNYGSVNGSVSGGGGLTYIQTYNTGVGVEYSGAMCSFRPSFPLGVPVRQTIRWEDSTKFSFITNSKLNYGTTCSGLTDSVVYDGFHVNMGSVNNGNGKIQSIRMYNRSLEDYELAHNFALDKERFNLS